MLVCRVTYAEERDETQVNVRQPCIVRERRRAPPERRIMFHVAFSYMQRDTENTV